jgi:hypothetical protein
VKLRLTGEPAASSKASATRMRTVHVAPTEEVRKGAPGAIVTTPEPFATATTGAHEAGETSRMVYRSSAPAKGRPASASGSVALMR